MVRYSSMGRRDQEHSLIVLQYELLIGCEGVEQHVLAVTVLVALTLHGISHTPTGRIDPDPIREVVSH